MTLKNFFENKIFKINIILIISSFLMIISLLAFFSIRNENLEQSNLKIFVNYLSYKIENIFYESERYYNDFLEHSLKDYYNNDYPNIESFIDDLKYELKNVKKELIVENINYFFINQKGIIYESDYKEDIGVDISNTSILWKKLTKINPGEVYLDSIAEEVRTGKNRLYAYLRLDNGDFFEIGLSFKNFSEIYENLKNELSPTVSDISIYSSYYISLLGDKKVTKEMKDFFKQSIEKNSLIVDKSILRDSYYYVIESDYGYKYITFSVKKEQRLILLIIILLSIFLVYIYINILKNKIGKDIYSLSSAISDIAKDMSFFDKENNLEFSYKYTGIDEIDTISKSYLEMTKEIKSNFKELKTINKKLEEYLKNNELLVDRMNKLTKVVIEFKNYKKNDEIFLEVFNLLFDLIPESDTGLLIQTDEEYLRVVDSKGYEKDKINNLKISSKNCFGLDNVSIIKGKDSKIKNFKCFDESNEKFEELKKYIYEIENLLYIPISSNSKKYGTIILNIIEKNKTFTEGTVKFANFFQKIINLYLTAKNYGEDIRISYRNFSNKLAVVAEAHDHVTGNHILRVGKLSAFIAEKFGLDKEMVQKIEDFASLHDIGKIFVPSSILKKPGKLTEEEWEIMKTHTTLAEKLLGGDEKFKIALNIALYHHEKYNGSGYPKGLKGEEIPIEAQIIAIVDVYDALRSKRPYKEAYTHEKSLEIIFDDGERTNKKHFNPKILDIVRKYNKEIDDLWNRF